MDPRAFVSTSIDSGIHAAACVAATARDAAHAASTFF